MRRRHDVPHIHVWTWGRGTEDAGTPVRIHRRTRRVVPVTRQPIPVIAYRVAVIPQRADHTAARACLLEDVKRRVGQRVARDARPVHRA